MITFTFWLENIVTGRVGLMVNKGITVFLVMLSAILIFLPLTSHANAQTQSSTDYAKIVRYVYADPLPQWASFDSDVVERAIKAWESANPNLSLQQVDSLDKADLHIIWAKDGSDEAQIATQMGARGSPSNGITLLPKYTGLSYTTIIATLGNENNCFKSWEPNSPSTLSRIVEHEMGHFLGFDHTPNPYGIMHEGAPQKYFEVTRSFEIPSSAGIGVRIWCAMGDTENSPTTFNYEISSDDLTGFHFSFYHVSVVNGQAASTLPPVQYSQNGCSGGGVTDLTATCSVSRDSVLNVILNGNLGMRKLVVNLWDQPSTYLTELEEANAQISGIPTSSQLFNLPANTGGTEMASKEVQSMQDFPAQYTDTGVQGMVVKNSLMWPNSVIVYVKQSENNGEINLDFVRSEIDSKVGISDDKLALISDGSKISWTEIDTDTDRHLTIDFNGLVDQIVITKPNSQSTLGQSSSASIQQVSIPQWIKNNAKWWSDGTIDDSTFASGIEYLIKQGIINVPPTQAGSTTSQVIPSWVKNNAKWWAESQVSDDEFIKAIQYLVSSGIIQVNS